MGEILAHISEVRHAGILPCTVLRQSLLSASGARACPFVVVVIVIKAANLDGSPSLPHSLARSFSPSLPSSPSPLPSPAQLPVCPQYCASFHCGRAELPTDRLTHQATIRHRQPQYRELTHHLLRGFAGKIQPCYHI